MTVDSDKETKTFVKTVTTWHSARVVFSAFIAAHPELGLKDSKITFRNFDLPPLCRTKVMEQSPLISENSGYETIQIYR